MNDTYRPGTWGDAGQFQQRPAPSGGLLFKRDWIKVVDTVPGEVVATVRSWDVAGTTETQRTHSTARTAGVRMSRTTTGAFVITDIVKGWWSDHEVDAAMRQAAQLDGPEVEVREEQEPGSSGLAVVNARRKALAGYPYRGVRPMTDKVTRARPMASQAEGGHVMILVPQADGVPDARAQTMAKEFLDELEMFPAGTLKDQVDAASQALNVLTGVAEPLEITRGPQAAPQTPEEMQAEEARRSAEARQAVDDAIARDGVYWP
ncbi:MAG: phage terminase large subunit [Rhodospirillaceae bacterium]